jgi:DNA repair exonuclease SbcCD ATPase subunit
MIPKRIELENFLSFGKPAVEFTFTDDEPLWALCGRNGVGKSTVFDGITYALYGQHRGGSQKDEQLIRHGANGFRVVLEFEFADAEYRVTRARSRRTTQKVERRRDGAWEAVPGVNSDKQVTEWVERLLGLGFKAFTTSVLLRQGEADKLFSASRDERIAVLKGIIGFERYEEVSERVHAATLDCGATLDTLRRQLLRVVPVAPEELTAAGAAVADAERVREDAQTALTGAAQRVEQAKRWQELETDRARLERLLTEAERRAADAVAIRAAKARLDDLAGAVPELEALVRLRDKVDHVTPALEEAQSNGDRSGADVEATGKALGEVQQKEERHRGQAAEFSRRAKELGEEIGRGDKFLALADEVQAVEEKLAAYPADLAERLAQAEADAQAAGDRKQAAAGKLAAAGALLQQATEQRDRFADVQVGVTCSRCGKLVDEVHAATERARLASETKTREAEVGRLRAVVANAEQVETAARALRATLRKDKAAYDKLAAVLAATRGSLATLGGVCDPAELRTRLAEQRQEMGQAEAHGEEERAKLAEAAKEAGRLDRQLKTLEQAHKQLAENVRSLELDLSAARASYGLGLGRLAADWQERLPALDAEKVGQLARERDGLRAAGVAEQFDLLRQDDERRAEWSRELAVVQTAVAGIPAEARVPETDAERRGAEAKAAWDAANKAWYAAVRTRDGLQDRAEQCVNLTVQVRDAEREHGLHKKLDDLLGQNGLQRELVRGAEQQIVALANDTLQHLSDGDLSLEQDEEASGRDDKAFALRVRRAGDPLPIGVLFLSGSQKFRVAVSVALAVGRFACRRARPLEAVIIDEGFGSLDKDGLRAMADELKRLQRSQSLKRVILVSHQEEFTNQFPVGYRLSPGENGTVAAPFRG